MVMHELFSMEYFRHGIDAPRQCQWNRVQDAVFVRPAMRQLLTETYSLITVKVGMPERGRCTPAMRHLLTTHYSLITDN
jgi:hypothetical protein